MMRNAIRKGFGGLAALLLQVAATACDGAIYDEEGDCSVTYRVAFRYDMNMKFADAFAAEVRSVTLYLLDEEGRVVWQRNERGEALSAEGYALTADVPAGSYELLAWCGGEERTTGFAVPAATEREGLTCTVEREREADGTAVIRTDLTPLFHGHLPLTLFPDGEGVHTFTVPLVKNTNTVRIVLQQLSGGPLAKEDFCFFLTDENGFMDWDNTLLPDEPISCQAWHVEAGGADMEYGGGETTLGAVVAELTTNRLVEGHDVRLTVAERATGRTVFSIPFIDYALLVKGNYRRNMDNQEYLDRQDEYNLVFFLDERGRWIRSYIYINSWKVVLQEAEL